MNSALKAPATACGKSRVTNGSAVLPGVDGRSMTARRYRDLIQALTAEQEGPLTTALELQIRAAAAMQVHVEEMTARMARGEPVAAEEMSRAANGAVRALAALRPRAPARKQSTTAGLTGYLAKRQPEVA